MTPIRNCAWFKRAALAVLLALPAVVQAADAPNVNQRFLLSNQGSGRATGYVEFGKIVTIGDKTHVAWLDATKEGFFVRARTLDRTTGEWGPTVTIGKGQDNHGGPSMVADSKGYLHVVYFPHHRPFHYRQSVRPNDISEWTPETEFAESMSYPVLLCGPDDTIYLTGRRYYEAIDHLNEMELWKKPAGGAWEKQGTILRSRYLDYVHFQESTAWSPDRKTIHMSLRIYETNGVKGEKPIETRGYLVSHDLGVTWEHSDGKKVALPATAETIEVLDRGGENTGRTLYAGAMAVSPAGVPYLLHSLRVDGIGRSYLMTPKGDGTWTKLDLHPFLPEAYRDWDLTMIGAATFSDSGRLTVVAQVVKLGPNEVDWAHPTTEIARLWSEDGGKTFQSEILAPVDPKVPHWLPAIERPMGHNRVPDQPGIIFTAGESGGGLHDLDLGNEVWWQPGN